MTAVLTEIINLLVSGITNVATGIGTGVSQLVSSIFLTGAGTTESPYALSVFGGVVIVFAGISLAKQPLARLNRVKSVKNLLSQYRVNLMNFARS